MLPQGTVSGAACQYFVEALHISFRCSCWNYDPVNNCGGIHDELLLFGRRRFVPSTGSPPVDGCVEDSSVRGAWFDKKPHLQPESLNLLRKNPEFLT